MAFMIDEETIDYLQLRSHYVCGYNKYGNWLYESVCNNDANAVKNIIPYVTDIDGINFENKHAALHRACQDGLEVVAKILLDSGACPDKYDCNGDTPLHVAARCGHANIVKLLLKYDANIDKNRFGENVQSFSPLDSAVIHNQIDVVKVLLENKADVCQAILTAVEKGNANCEIVELLINYGAKVNEIDDNKYTALHFASIHGQAKIAEILIDNFADVNKKNKDWSTPMHLAASKGHKDVVKLLLDCNNNLQEFDVNEKTPFHLALANGHTETMKIFLEHNEDFSRDLPFETTSLTFCDYIITYLLDNVPLSRLTVEPLKLLTCSCKGGFTKIVNYILEKFKPDVKSQCVVGESPFHLAARNGHKDIVELLIDYGIDINTKNPEKSTVLHQACSRGQLDVAKFLLKLIDKNSEVKKTGVSFEGKEFKVKSEEFYNYKDIINDIDYLGNTPLCLAVEGEHTAVVKLLLEYKADATIKDKSNNTLLHKAILKKSIDICQMLLENIKNISSQDHLKNRNYLHLAAEQGNEQIFKLLINQGIDVNEIEEIEENTPLHVACYNGKVEIVQLLLENKAVTNKRNSKFKTPLHLAIKKCHNNVIKLLLDNNVEYGDDPEQKFQMLHYAIKNNATAFVAYILENQQLKKTQVKDLFFHAAFHRCTKAMQLLTEKYSINVNNKNSKNERPLLLACGGDFEDFYNICFFTVSVPLTDFEQAIHFLLNAGAKVNIADQQGITPLHVASKKGYLSVVRHLLDLNANIHAKDEKGYTALFYACLYSQNEEVVSLLLKRGACVDQRSNDGEQVIHKMFRLTIPGRNHLDILAVLLKFNANINATNSMLMTPLHIASRGIFHINGIEFLIKKGACIDAVDIHGSTPLIFAVMNCRHHYNVKLLLENNACVNFQNHKGITCLHYIERSFNSFSPGATIATMDVFKILLMYGADPNIADEEGVSALAIFSGYIKSHYRKLQKEIKKMKKLKLNNRVSMYDFLLMKGPILGRYATNEILKEMYEKPNNFSLEFKEYGQMLTNQYENCIYQRNILKCFKKAFDCASGVMFPDLSVYEEIFSYLTAVDLGNLYASRNLVLSKKRNIFKESNLPCTAKKLCI